ncbi:MAG: hypothetical protein Kow0037_11320 [Calditrichia bacterium]
MEAQFIETNFLEVLELTVVNQQKKTLLDSITFSLKKGECLGLLGPSGAGKSLTGKAIAGLLPEGISRANGFIFLKGKSLQIESERFMGRFWGRAICYLPQKPRLAFNPLRPVGKQIQDVLIDQRGLNPENALRQANIYLLQVGFSDAERVFFSYPYQLSTGMLQRILMALVMAAGPELLIVDELTASLDNLSSNMLINQLNTLRQQLNCSIIIIDHNLKNLARFSDRILVFDSGKIIEENDTRQILFSPGNPITAKIVEAYRELYPDWFLAEKQSQVKMNNVM